MNDSKSSARKLGEKDSARKKNVARRHLQKFRFDQSSIRNVENGKQNLILNTMEYVAKVLKMDALESLR